MTRIKSRINTTQRALNDARERDAQLMLIDHCDTRSRIATIAMRRYVNACDAMQL